jgi:hypothetical protein
MSEWLQIKSIEMLVSNAEYSIENSKEEDLLFFSCDLLNIARGRCNIFLKKNQSSNLKNFIEIDSEKPVMNADINFESNKFENIAKVINNYTLNKSKKIKIILDLNVSLAVNQDGTLSIENSIKVDITNIKFILPLI